MKIVAFLIVALFILRFVAFSQEPPQQPDRQIDADTRAAVVDALLRELNDSYVFADTAKRMEADIRGRVAAKEYDSIMSAREFAKKLTADLQSASKDKHLRVRYSYPVIPVRQDARKPSAEEVEHERWFSRRINFGFERVERMQGNIGYIDLRGFNDAELGAATVAAAMIFLQNTEAIIFDLRENGGGSPQMIALISSYLFGDKPVHLNDLYWRKGNKTDEFWTKPSAAKVKFPNKDIYVLTSSYTFSAAEEFSYNLKNLKRATIVGETTGGGAHPGGLIRLHDHFGAFIPFGRAINPISKTNWEGTGVEPDIKVPKKEALQVAYLAALKKSLANVKDEQVLAGVNELIAETQRKLDEIRAQK